MSLQTQCPHCEKLLSLKTSSALGKKTKCPKCQEPFVVKKYTAPAEDVDYIDDYEDDVDDAIEDYEDYDAEEATPSRRSSRGSRARGKPAKKKSGGAAKALLPVAIGVGVLCAIGLLGWGGFVLISKLGSRNIVNMQYFPEETEMLVHLRPDEMWNAPLLTDVRNHPLIVKQMQEAQNGLDVQLGDCESISFGVTNLAQRQMMNRFTGSAMGPVTSAGPQETLGVIRFKKDISQADLEKVPNTTKSTHAGQTLLSRSKNGTAVTSWLANPRLVVFGSEAGVKAAIDRGPKEFRFKHLDFGKVNHQFSVVAAPRGEAKPMKVGAPGTFDAAMNEHTKGFSLGLSLTTEVVMESRIVCFDSNGATVVKTELDKAVTEGRQKLQEIPPFIANSIKPLLDVGNETLNSVKVTTSGTSVNVDARISNKIVDAFKQLSSNPLFSGMLGGAEQQPPTMPTQPMPVSPGLTPNGQSP